MTGRDWKEKALDGYLVASARIGDRKAFELLAERWDPRLRAHAFRLLGDADQARDAVQDAWTEIVRGLGALREEIAFPAWAYRIVSRRCARTIRRVQRGRAVARELAAEPARAAAGASDFELLRAAIRALPPEQRAAVALFYYEDLTIADISIALDVPAGTVKTRLMHARRKLRSALEGDTRCVTSTE